jgi:hypothetical protein
MTMGYDIDNRLQTVKYLGMCPVWKVGDDFYGYSPDNKRVFQRRERRSRDVLSVGGESGTC